MTPFNNALGAPDVASTMDMNTDAGRAMLDHLVTQQATVSAYQNDFLMLMYLTIVTLPLLLILGTLKTRKSAAQQAAAPVHAMD